MLVTLCFNTDKGIDFSYTLLLMLGATREMPQTFKKYQVFAQ